MCTSISLYLHFAESLGAFLFSSFIPYSLPDFFSILSFLLGTFASKHIHPSINQPSLLKRKRKKAGTENPTRFLKLLRRFLLAVPILTLCCTYFSHSFITDVVWKSSREGGSAETKDTFIQKGRKRDQWLQKSLDKHGPNKIRQKKGEWYSLAWICLQNLRVSTIQLTHS